MPGKKSKQQKHQKRGRGGSTVMSHTQITDALGRLQTICNNKGLGDPFSWATQPRFNNLHEAIEGARAA